MTDGPLPRDRFIPWYFVGAFVLLFIINGIMVYTAVSTGTGVVTDKAYERGLAYNDFLAAQEAQQQRGWQGEVRYEAGQLVFNLKDKDGTALTGATVKAQIIRPVQAGMDFNLELTEAEPGRYVAAASFPQPGLWTGYIDAQWQGQPYRQAQDLVIKP